MTWSRSTANSQELLNIVLRGQGMAGVLLPAAALLGMAALFFVVEIARFKYE